jgi:hypothetical protein
LCKITTGPRCIPRRHICLQVSFGSIPISSLARTAGRFSDSSGPFFLGETMTMFSASPLRVWFVSVPHGRV